MFDPPLRLPHGVLRPRSDGIWRRKVTDIMERFGRAFPDIVYDIAWEVDALNGVAWRQVSEAHVRLYGGLLRHRTIGPEAVALLFAHETGHHKGGLPRDKYYKWMTCERQADFWAARYGVSAAWPGEAEEAKRQVLIGARQLLAFENKIGKRRNAEYLIDQFSKCNRDHPMPDERFEIFVGAVT